MRNHQKNELHNIISGKSQVSFGTTIQAVASYISDGSQSGAETEMSKQIRKKETMKL
jgi:hypothetical protein